MAQDLEITLVYESDSVQYYKGDIVSDLVPIRVGTANIRLRLENLSDCKVVFGHLDWKNGQPDFIKDEKVSPHLIVIHDENVTREQRGHFSFQPQLDHEGRRIPGPDPTIINTDIPGGAAARPGKAGKVA